MECALQEPEPAVIAEAAEALLAQQSLVMDAEDMEAEAAEAVPMWCGHAPEASAVIAALAAELWCAQSAALAAEAPFILLHEAAIAAVHCEAIAAVHAEPLAPDMDAAAAVVRDALSLHANTVTYEPTAATDTSRMKGSTLRFTMHLRGA